jgi:hypothetical protein
MLASLNHPHIGGIYGVEESDGAPALVLELVEGLTLADRVARRPAWSPTAGMITYLEVLPNKPGQQAQAYVRFMTSSGQPITLDVGQTVSFVNGFLAWSRDGRKLAAMRVPGTAAASVWITDLDAGRPIHQVLMLPGDALVRGIVWSGDGRSVIIGQQRASSDIVLFDQTTGSP